MYVTLLCMVQQVLSFSVINNDNVDGYKRNS